MENGKVETRRALFIPIGKVEMRRAFVFENSKVENGRMLCVLGLHPVLLFPPEFL